MVALIAMILGLWLLTVGARLLLAARHPVDGYFVLGGSIRREIVVADLVRQRP